MDIREFVSISTTRPNEIESKGCIRFTIRDDYYPGLIIQGASPRWYYNKPHHGKDEYSKRLLNIKRNVDETAYFKPHIETCIEAFDDELGFSSADVISLIPNSNNEYYVNMRKIAIWISAKFNKRSFPTLRRKPGRRDGNSRENRYKDVHGKFEVIKRDDIIGKKILLIDDIRASGISILECSDVLLKSGTREIISLTLGTNTSKEPPKHG